MLPQAREKLNDLIDGRLNRFERARLVRELAADQHLRWRYERLSRLRSTIRHYPRIVPPRGFSRRTLERVRWDRERSKASLLGAACFVAACFFFAFLGVRARVSPERAGSEREGVYSAAHVRSPRSGAMELGRRENAKIGRSEPESKGIEALSWSPYTDTVVIRHHSLTIHAQGFHAPPRPIFTRGLSPSEAPEGDVLAAEWLGRPAAFCRRFATVYLQAAMQ